MVQQERCKGAKNGSPVHGNQQLSKWYQVPLNSWEIIPGTESLARFQELVRLIHESQQKEDTTTTLLEQNNSLLYCKLCPFTHRLSVATTPHHRSHSLQQMNNHRKPQLNTTQKSRGCGHPGPVNIFILQLHGQGTSQERGWEDCKSQNTRKSTLQQSLLETNRTETMAISMEMLIQKGRTLWGPPLSKELKTANNYLGKENWPLPGMSFLIGCLVQSGQSLYLPPTKTYSACCISIYLWAFTHIYVCNSNNKRKARESGFTFFF